MPDRRYQPAGTVHAIPKTQARCRNCKAARGIRVAQVARKRHRQSAADTEAVDQRDRRFGGRLDGMMRGARRGFVFFHVTFAGAILLELGDVRAGRERLRSLAANHDAADGRIGVESGYRRRDRPPHVGADGIAPFRIVQHQAANRPVALHAQFAFAHACSLDSLNPNIKNSTQRRKGAKRDYRKAENSRLLRPDRLKLTHLIAH